MKIKSVPLIVFLLFITFFVIFFKGLKNSNIYVPSVNYEKEIPIFITQFFDTNIKINSDEIFKEDYYYLMNIWSSWCLPCREEHRFLMELNKEKNLKIIGFNYKDNIKDAKKFLDELKNPYSKIFLDKDGLIAIEWGAYGVPESFLIHKKNIIKKIIGPINKKKLIEIKGLIN